MRCNIEDVIFPLLLLFGGRTGLPVKAVIGLGRHFGLTSQAIRTYLCRISAKGLACRCKSAATVSYQLTEKGQKIAGTIGSSFNPPPRQWNGQWSMVAFSVPGQERSARDKLRRKLYFYRYRQWYKGLWIRPDNLDLPLADTLLHYIQAGQFNVFKGKLDAMESQKLAEQLFHVTALNSQFKREAGSLNHKNQLMMNCAGISILTQYLTIGNKYVKLLARDPLLPDQLLPSPWYGHELRKLFGSFNAGAFTKAQAFVTDYIKK